jgi:uncharacterized protein YndB with AHSA1/START domain
MKRLAAAAAIGAIISAPATAEVRSASVDAMILHFEGEVPLARAAMWTRAGKVGSWWSDAHTYSGKAANMNVALKAGGCWCETWKGGRVEHGRVTAIMDRDLLRFSAALGPLQELAVSGALTITLADGATAGTTKVSLDYVVVGGSLSGLDKLAPIVDGVVGEQFARLIKP